MCKQIQNIQPQMAKEHSIKSKPMRIIIITLILIMGSVLGDTAIALACNHQYSNNICEQLENIYGLGQLSENNEYCNNDAATVQQCATPVVMQARANWDLLNEDTRQFLSQAAKRPSEKVLEKSQVSKHFKIHYSMRAPHRPVSPKASEKEVQLWLETLKYYLEIAYYKFVHERGYRPPMPDGNRGGGNNLFDIYVLSLGIGVSGVTHSDGPAYQNSDKAITYMFVANNLPRRDAFGGNPIKATAAHELFHMIQNSYYGSALASLSGNVVNTAKSTSLREGTAVWAETVTYLPPHKEEENRSYLAYLPMESTIFSEPYKHLLINEEADVSIYAYSTVFFWKYLAEQYGEEIIKKIWEGNTENLRTITTIQKELAVLNDLLRREGGLEKVLGDFLVTSALMKNNDNYEYVKANYPKYALKEGRLYASFLPRKSPVTVLKKPAHYRNQAWHSPNTAEKVFWNLRSVGGVAYHAIERGKACRYKLMVQPARATYNLIGTDLYGVLLKENTRTGAVAVQRAAFNVTANSTTIVDNDPNFDKLTLAVFRLTDPSYAKSVGTSTIRYEIRLEPIEICNNGMAKRVGAGF